MFKKLDQKSILIYFLLLAFLPYCYLSFFSQPIAEDFGFAFQFQEHESFNELLKNSYLTMNGRYVSNVFMYLNPLSFNSFLGYKLFPILLIALLILGNYTFIKSLKITQQKRESFIYGLVVSIIFLHNLPIISEGLYWYTGSSIYLLGLVFTLFFLSGAAHLFHNYKNKKVLVGTSALLFLVCGFNEVLTLVIVSLLFFITLFLFYKNRPSKKVFLILAILAFAFAFLMIFAPGNTFREGMYPSGGDVSNTVFMSVLQTLRFGFIWVFSIPIIFASILLYQQVITKKIRVINLGKEVKWISLLFLPIIIIFCVAPPYWYTGILGQHRTLNVAYFFFIIVWFLNVAFWSEFVKQKRDKLNLKLSQKVYIALLLIGILFTGNGFNALSDIFSGDAKKFNEQMKCRHTVLLNSQEEPPKKIALKPITFKPKILFVMDISKDPNFWTNQGYNGFFKLPYTQIYTEEIKQ